MDNNTQKSSGVQIDIISIVRDVCRQWWVILLLSVSVYLLANVWVNASYQPQYTTTTTFVVTAKGTNNNIYQNLSTAKSMAEQFSQVLNSNVLKKKVMEDLGMDSFTATTSVNILSETNLMVLTVTDDSAMDAFRVLRSIMTNYNTVSDYVMDDVILEVLQEPEIPMNPSNSVDPNGIVKKSFFIAFAVFVVLFAVFSYIKDTVKNERDVKEKIDAKLMGVVYHERKAKSFRELKNARSFSLLLDNPLLSFRFVESNRMMASRVRSYMNKKGAKVLLVTSVLENEGKSTVAANLALSLAQEGRKVLLMDFDFRKPAQHKIFEAPEEDTVNLPKVLLKKGEMKEIIRQRNDSSLYTVFNNTPSSATEELLEKGSIQLLIQFFRSRMDYIIVDTSPMALVSDTEEIAQYVDASLLVMEQDLVLAKDINDTVDALNATKGKVLGCVFNDVVTGTPGRMSSYGYGGYYGKRTE